MHLYGDQTFYRILYTTTMFKSPDISSSNNRMNYVAATHHTNPVKTIGKIPEQYT